jgi:hypothetical protein
MHFEAISTFKPRTLKQSTTVIIIAAIIATITAAITAIIKKAKGRALPLERWH